jgi:hypothetical protein
VSRDQSPHRFVVAVLQTIVILDCGHVRARPVKPVPGRQLERPETMTCDACFADAEWVLKEYKATRGKGVR